MFILSKVLGLLFQAVVPFADLSVLLIKYQMFKRDEA